MKNKQKSKGLVPRLRFPGFQGEWEEKKLIDIFSLEYGSSLPEKDRTNEGFPVVGSNGIVGYHKTASVAGPVIVIGRKGSVGQINLINTACTPIDTTYYVVLKRPEYDSLFFIYRLLEFIELYKFQDASAVPGLSRNNVYTLLTAIPTLPEQQRIADCLSSLDELISVEGRKLEALRAHKKGLMQQLFPREGETVPRLRFPGFEGEWEKRSLSDIAISETSTLTQGKLTYQEFGYPVFGADGIVGKIETFDQFSDYIAIVKDGSGAGKLFYCSAKSSVSSTLNYIKVRKGVLISLKWLFYLLNTVDFSQYLKGSGIPHIYFSDYSKHQIRCPTLPEQQRIADCLSSLDELIAAQARKVELLKQHKKGLMQQLFPVMEEAGG